MKRPGLSAFNGFPAGKVRLSPVPATFFTELLPEIDHLGELKVVLYALWSLDQQDGDIRVLRRSDFCGDQRFMEGFGGRPDERERALDDALERACQRRVLVKVTPTGRGSADALYFLNSPRGRAAVTALEQGAWRPEEAPSSFAGLEAERPNIYLLYEQNIGPLTPMLADMLRDAEQTYPADWIEEALRIAVHNNARSWRYVEAILRSWKEKGRDEANKRDSQTNYRRYLEDEYAQYIEH